MHSTDDPEVLAPTSTPGDVASALDVPLRCVQCGYDLRGLPEDRCPECGSPGAVTQAQLNPDAWHLRTVKRRCLWCLAALYLALAVVDGIVPDLRALALAGGLLIALAGYFWYQSDRRLHRYEPSAVPALAVIFFLPLAIIGYLAIHRRWRSLLRCILFGTACILGARVLEAVIYFAVHGRWPF